jgi:periplasmic divalent cation tolerance protein
MPFVAAYVTWPSRTAAKKAAAALLGQRLIACANFFPIESAYRWKGNIETAKETVSLLKTDTRNWAKLVKEIERIHPYETPCVLRLEARANAAYEAWIHTESGGR